jgi:hypothetical protein
MTSANQKTPLPTVDEDPLQWLWARHQRKFSQRILQALIICILPTFLVSWFLLLGLDSNDMGEFAVLYSLAWHFFTVGFLIDQGTDLVRRFKESGMLPDILLTGYSLKDIHTSLTTAVKESIHQLLIWSAALQTLVIILRMLLESDSVHPFDDSIEVPLTYLLLMANYHGCVQMMRFLGGRLVELCLFKQITLMEILPGLVSLKVISYGFCLLLVSACFFGWGVFQGIGQIAIPYLHYYIGSLFLFIASSWLFHKPNLTISKELVFSEE